MAFHWKDGWFFTRLPDGSVEIRNHSGTDRRDPAGPHAVTLVIPINEWESIVKSVAEQIPQSLIHIGRDGYAHVGKRANCPACLNEQVDALRQALMGHSCPANCNVTVAHCVDRGECGCDNGAALIPGYKPGTRASEQSTREEKP